jgi:hypothetical protein
MDLTALADLMREQSGVVARRQVLAAGIGDSFIDKRLRRKDWARVHNGVYVNHTGPLTWMQRAWAALLFYWPAALSHESALKISGVRTDPKDDALIHVAVAQERRVHKQDGIRLHRVSRLPTYVQPNRSPARIRLEHSLLDVASAATGNDRAIALLGDACQQRLTTPARLVEALRVRPRLPRRQFLLEVLDDVANGVYSVLEHRYLTHVERPHGLPTARRQRRVRQGRTVAYRDVEYLALRTVVELDGRLGHEETLDRWNDLDRDIDSAVEGDLTLRVGWRHAEDPCRTATAVGRALQARGWAGRPRPCSPTCPVNRLAGGKSASRPEDAPRSQDPQAS